MPSTRARSAHRTATPVIDDWSSDPVLLATVPCLKEGKGRKEGREGRKEAFMVCEKGGLQFVGLYEILTEKDTPATGVEDSDCVHYSNSRLHPVHRVGFFVD